jgi:L-aspartate oxidase
MAAQGGLSVRLDATGLGGAFLAERFPTIDAATRSAGFDWSREPVPVTPAAHYWMGGIATDLDGHTSLPGLYAVGEAACTGVHGANRLASNSLLEGAVFADRAARDIASRGLDTLALPFETVAERPPQDRRQAQGPDAPYSTNRASTSDASIVDRSALQQLMWEAAGLWRSAESLTAAAETLEGWRGVDATSATISQREDANLLQLAGVLVRAALAREESRGAHFRSDFPATSIDYEHHLSWKREGALVC